MMKSLGRKLVCILLAAGVLLPLTASAAYQAGELHEDGVLDAFDLAIMKKSLADGTASANADLDNDGTLTQEDLGQMQDYLLGRINYFDAGISDGAVCLTDKLSAAPKISVATDDQFRLAQMEFAAQLFQQTAQTEENTMISPLSAMIALSMTANGAGSQTLAEMEDVLCGGMGIADHNAYLSYYMNQLDSRENCKLQIADSIWYRDDEKLTIQDNFLQVNKDYYDAQIYKAAFDSRTVRDINSWVKKNTDGMIPEIIQELTPESMAVLINAITFDAEWQEKYYDYQIWEDTFTAADGTAQTAEMMSSQEDIYYDFGNATGFGKNYTGKYRFVAILPEEGMTVSEWIAQMDAAEVVETLQNPTDAIVYADMPKFSYDTSLELNESLQNMGMSTAFNPDAADFYTMGNYGGYSLYISKVIQKTHITVDNVGTRAAAVTAVIMDPTSAAPPDEIYYVTLDRPFVYMIVDTTNNLPIFMGTVQSLA